MPMKSGIIIRNTRELLTEAIDVLEVIGVGFGRTGTLSLKRALETLGFGKCYHFSEMLRVRHARQWLQIADGGPADWETLFQGYRSTTDWPAASYYRELAAHYPDAKLILTVRDTDEWYDSVSSTIRRLRKAMPANWPVLRTVAAVSDRIVWDGEFKGHGDDREYVVSRFREHNDEVQRTMPAERLLVYDVRDGWEPLCRFLGVAVPGNTPFPRANDRLVMRRYIRLLLIARYALPASAIIAILAAVVLLVSSAP